MGKKSKKKKTPVVKFRLSSLGTWCCSTAGTWNLDEDRRFTIYEGQTPDTRGQWFLVERDMTMYPFLLRSLAQPMTPHFLGACAGLDAALDQKRTILEPRRKHAHQRLGVSVRAHPGVAVSACGRR